MESDILGGAGGASRMIASGGPIPQENINEIHGSWFDPSNPVVKYSGSLQTELFEGMVRRPHTRPPATFPPRRLSSCRWRRRCC